MQTKLETVLSFYLPLVEKKNPAKVEAARQCVIKHWDSQAENTVDRGMSGQRVEVNQHTVVQVLRELALRKPEFASELKSI